MADKSTTVVSTKGQVILPKAICEQRRRGLGTRLVVEEVAGGVLLKPARPFAPTKVADVFGSLKYTGKPKTIEEMDEGIAAEVRRRHARGRYQRHRPLSDPRSSGSDGESQAPYRKQ